MSRAIWLARMLELHRMGNKDPKGTSSRQPFLPATTDLVVLEERRKTLWAAYSLNIPIGIGVGRDTYSAMDYREVSGIRNSYFDDQERTSELYII